MQQKPDDDDDDLSQATDRERKPTFGTRFLTNVEDVWQHNSWDQVDWDEEMLADAHARVAENSVVTMNQDKINSYLNSASSHWDTFYESHESKFFKDRHWLQTEFPNLMKGRADSRLRLLEVGCGAGNAIFPLLDETKDSELQVFACDHSSVAIEVLKKNSTYIQHHNKIRAFVCDITNDEDITKSFRDHDLAENSLDLLTMIFTMSAIRPEKHAAVIKSLGRYMKTGGTVLFRDYCRLDMAQLRFKKGQCLDNNLYLRTDGTTSYFFSLDEVERLFLTEKYCPGNPVFTKQLLMEDRRLIVNRARRLRMYRSWIQARFTKL